MGGRGDSAQAASLCAVAFSFPVGMDQTGSPNCNLNVKLSKELTFHIHRRQTPKSPTETALGVSPKGTVAPPWSRLSVERGCRPDGPGRQPAAEVSSNKAKGKCLSLQVTGRSSPTPISAHSLGLWQFGGSFLH